MTTIQRRQTLKHPNTQQKRATLKALTAEIGIRNTSGRYDTLALHEATATQIREATALVQAHLRKAD